MKKLFAVILIVSLLLSLTSCFSSTPATQTEGTVNNTTNETEQPNNDETAQPEKNENTESKPKEETVSYEILKAETNTSKLTIHKASDLYRFAIIVHL